MELSYWGISPNIPAWPTDENGEREQAVGVGLYVPASMAEDAQNLLASMPMPNEAGE